MRIPIWLEKLILSFSPRLLPKRAEAIRRDLEKIFLERWMVVTNRIQTKELALPKFKVDFSYIGAYLRKREIVIGSSSIYISKEQRVRRMDHEIIHYIQHVKNPNINKNISLVTSFLEAGKDILSEFKTPFIWIFRGSASRFLTKRAFQEGFAEYLAFKTSRTLRPDVRNAVKTIQNGKKWKLVFSKALPYTIGYLTYSAIEQVKTEKEAIRIGFTEGFSYWASEGRKAFLAQRMPSLV